MLRVPSKRCNTSLDDQYDRVAPFRKVLSGYTEILDLILERLVPKSSSLVPPQDRNSLSQESFAAFPDIGLISIFRLICPACSEVGLRRQFLRVVIRLEAKGFDRLLTISENANLAATVKQFSYMIPRVFPQVGSQFESLLQQVDERVAAPVPQSERAREQDIDLIMAVLLKSNEQRVIMGEKVDIRTLEFAMRRFLNLQQIRLMKVEDQTTARWTRFLQRHPAYSEEFSPAPLTDTFIHAARTLSTAIRQLRSPVTRFSSRFMDPLMPLILAPQIALQITDFIGNLNYLEQEFRDDAGSLETKLPQLAPLFLTVWNAAQNLQGLHVGFTHRLSIPLETVFQNVHLPRLKHFGIHLWYLESDEIIDLLERHRETIQSIRFRFISLRAGRWKSILEFIRLRFRLRWISLRGIGYNAGPPDLGAMGFAPVPASTVNLQYNDDTDSEFSWEVSTDDDRSLTEDGEGESGFIESGLDIGSSQLDADEDLDSSDHEGSFEHNDESSIDDGVEDELSDEHESDIEEFRGVEIGDHTPPNPQRFFTASPKCECSNGFAFTDLDDNGLTVTPQQWKKWEEWCKKRCALHDPLP